MAPKLRDRKADGTAVTASEPSASTGAKVTKPSPKKKATPKKAATKPKTAKTGAAKKKAMPKKAAGKKKAPTKAAAKGKPMKPTPKSGITPDEDLRKAMAASKKVIEGLKPVLWDPREFPAQAVT